MSLLGGSILLDLCRSPCLPGKGRLSDSYQVTWLKKYLMLSDLVTLVLTKLSTTATSRVLLMLIKPAV